MSLVVLMLLLLAEGDLSGIFLTGEVRKTGLVDIVILLVDLNQGPLVLQGYFLLASNALPHAFVALKAEIFCSQMQILEPGCLAN